MFLRTSDASLSDEYNVSAELFSPWKETKMERHMLDDGEWIYVAESLRSSCTGLGQGLRAYLVLVQRNFL